MLAAVVGTPLALSEVVDASGLAGSLSASIDWGDGTITSAKVSGGGSGSLVGRVDYSLDTNKFFDSQLKRDLFQQAVDAIVSRFGDDLSAILPSGSNMWSADFPHPGTGASHTITNLNVSENEIVIFAGGRELDTSLAVGGPGGFQVSCSDMLFCDAVATRGELGARTTLPGSLPNDFGPWGGSISFDATANFHYSHSIDDLGTQQIDFLSTAMHEVAHLLGFGTSRSWTTFVSNGNFNGPASRLANDNQSVPLASGGTHWANGTTSDGREAALDPSLTVGTRKLLTPLDFAGLDDVGWDLIQPTVVSGSHTYADDGVYEIVVTLMGTSDRKIAKALQIAVASGLSWHNTALPWDVSGDRNVSAIDALQVINNLNLYGPRRLGPLVSGNVPPYLDVDNDGSVSPIDVLLIVNYLNSGSRAPEGESAASVPLSRHPFDAIPLVIDSAAGTADAQDRLHQTSRRNSKHEIALLSNELVDTSCDDIVADITAALMELRLPPPKWPCRYRQLQ